MVLVGLLGLFFSALSFTASLPHGPVGRAWAILTCGRAAQSPVYLTLADGPGGRTSRWFALEPAAVGNQRETWPGIKRAQARRETLAAQPRRHRRPNTRQKRMHAQGTHFAYFCIFLLAVACGLACRQGYKYYVLPPQGLEHLFYPQCHCLCKMANSCCSACKRSWQTGQHRAHHVRPSTGCT